MKGQGATEYLVLLAVVLIVALISVALLGFFPGMASDAQITQSQMYWQSMQPIAISETAGAYYYYNGGPVTAGYFRIRNTGTYPIRLVKLIGAEGVALSLYHGGGVYHNMTEIYLGPGEETCFGSIYVSNYCPLHWISFLPIGTSGWSHTLSAASSMCSSDGKGTLQVNKFGFEYIEYIDGQQITKREIGAKPLILKCQGAV